MVHKAGYASRNTATGGCFGDPLKIAKIIFYVAIVDLIEADGVKAPGYRSDAETLAQGSKLLQAFTQRRYAGFQQWRLGVYGKIEKKIESFLPQLLADAPFQERAEVFGPEHNAVDCLGSRRYPGDFTVIGIGNFKVTPIDLIHKPVQIKRRNIGSSGS